MKSFEYKNCSSENVIERKQAFSDISYQGLSAPSLSERLVDLMATLPGSTIAEMLPVVNRYALKMVSLEFLLSNQQLRHQFIFCEDLNFQPIPRLYTEGRHLNYWGCIKREIHWILARRYSDAPPLPLYEQFQGIPLIYIPLFLNEMREILATIKIKGHQKFPAYELLECEKIFDYLEKGMEIHFEAFLPLLFTNLITTFKLICKEETPRLDGVSIYEILQGMKLRSYSMSAVPDDLVLFLQNFMDAVEMLKLASVNKQLTIHRPVLIGLISSYEYEELVYSGNPYFKLHKLFLHLYHEFNCTGVEDIYYELIWKIISNPCRSCDIPETLLLDIQILKDSSHSFELIIRIYVFLLSLQESFTRLSKPLLDFIGEPNGVFSNLLASSLKEQKRSFSLHIHAFDTFENSLFCSMLEIFQLYTPAWYLELQRCPLNLKLAISIALTHFSPIHYSKLFSVCKLRLKVAFFAFFKHRQIGFKHGDNLFTCISPMLIALLVKLGPVVQYNYSTFKVLYCRTLDEITQASSFSIN